jgi:hypothetical protein
LRRTLEDGQGVADLMLRGVGDALRIEGRIEVRGVWSRAALELAEIRVRRRTLGFRLRRPRILGGLPIPRSAIEALFLRLGLAGLTVFRGSGIVVVDLDRWLPPGLELELVSAHATELRLHLWLGPGRLRDLPGGHDTAAVAEAPPPHDR